MNKACLLTDFFRLQISYCPPYIVIRMLFCDPLCSQACTSHLTFLEIMLISFRILYEKIFNYDARHIFISEFSFIYYLLFSFPVNTRSDFFALGCLFETHKSRILNDNDNRRLSPLSRLLCAYFILNEVLFTRLYNVPYVMPLNSVSVLPCHYFCVFLISMSSFSVYKRNLRGCSLSRKRDT
jgi:hypothetical protein